MVQRFWPFCSSRCFTVMSRPLLLVRTFGAQSRLILEIDIRERLPVGVADDEAGLLLVDRPGRREAARRMGGEERGGSAAECTTGHARAARGGLRNRAPAPAAPPISTILTTLNSARRSNGRIV